MGTAFAGFFGGALGLASIWTDETGEPVARVGKLVETCHTSQGVLSIFESVDVYVSMSFPLWKRHLS
jgi:hypothetical protein